MTGSAHVSKVAEAIWSADNRSTAYWPSRTWVDIREDERQAYVELALAAIDALGLTEEWGSVVAEQEPGVHRSREHAERSVAQFAELNPRLVTRLVGSWVRAGET